nr:hypothetical protein [uncultured Treponema sp.]
MKQRLAVTNAVMHEREAFFKSEQLNKVPTLDGVPSVCDKLTGS